MRIANIFCNNDQKYRQGHINIDISAQSKRQDVINILPNDIADFFESEEFDSIIINNCINFFDGVNQAAFIKNMSSKLTKNGSLHISFYDVEELARKFLNSKMGLDELNQILYMENGVNKMSVSTLASVTQSLTKNGFVIHKASFSDAFCSLEGIKK